MQHRRGARAVATISLVVVVGAVALNRVKPTVVAAVTTKREHRDWVGAPDYDPLIYFLDSGSTAAEKLAPSLVTSVIDVHEHVSDVAAARRLLRVMDLRGIRLACLMGSSTFTLTGNSPGFNGYRENNEQLLQIKARWPGRFAAFVTINPADAGQFELLRQYVARGADGLKLYLGHGGTIGDSERFHSMPLDDPRLDRMWSWLESTQLPVVLHVNLGLYWDEMLRLMEKHPYLRMNMPHLGLYKSSGLRLARLEFLLQRYPFLYTDISFGQAFTREDFESLAKWRDRSRRFLIANQNKVLFGTDQVVTSETSDANLDAFPAAYLQFLQEARWRFFQKPAHAMRGLALDTATLGRLLYLSAREWLQIDSSGRIRGGHSAVTEDSIRIHYPVAPLRPEDVPPGPPATNGQRDGSVARRRTRPL